ncbi:MAG: hypothetical protein U5J97_02330 [Trueperaceae bacterium]|nr:hypothetical protein [Trueperaceae bacterium]
MPLSMRIASRCASDMLATGGWRIHMARITMRHLGYPFAVLQTDTGFDVGLAGVVLHTTSEAGRSEGVAAPCGRRARTGGW